VLQITSVETFNIHSHATTILIICYTVSSLEIKTIGCELAECSGQLLRVLWTEHLSA